MRNFKKLAVLLAVTLVLESFSPVSTSIAAENVGSEMFAAVEDVSLGDVSVGDALLTDVSADEVLDEIPADVSGADVEIEAPTTAETVSDGNVSEESIIEEPIIEEPVAETTPEEAEVVEETEAQIEAIETPGNVAVTVLPIEGTTTFYSGDMDFVPWGNGGKVVAQAFFETATGVDESKFGLDGTHFALFKKGEGTMDMDGATYGVRVSVVEKTKIKLTFCEGTKCGTYTLYIPVSGCDTNVMAEFNFTIKPSAYYATVYVNKNKESIRIYTDGKKKLSLPLTAKALSQDELPVSLKNVKYALSKWSAQDEHVYISGSKLIIDKGFSGKKTFSVDATATDSSGHNVDAYIYGSIIVTSTPDVPRYLGVFEPDVEEPERILEPELFLEPLNPVYFKPGQLNGKEISIIDNENEYYIDASVKVSGKAIKLIPVDGCAYTTYRIEETGAGGDATITVTSDCGKQKAVFQIHIDKYDNTGLALYSESQQYEPMASSYECTGLFENFMVGKEKTETYEKIDSKIGNWTVSAKGAQVKVDEWGRIEYIPLQKNSTITLKAGKETKTYNITNTVLPETLPAAKNVTATVCNVVYSLDGPLYRKFTVKGLPGATNKFEFYEDFACTKKLKSAEANEQYDHFMELLNDGGFAASGTLNEYIYGFDLDDQVPAGKYSFYVVPVEEVNWEDTCTTKPFKLTITVSAKIPKASVRLVKKTVEIEVGGAGKIELSPMKNVYGVSKIVVLDGKSNKMNNQFSSYFQALATYTPSEMEGGYAWIANTEPHPEKKNMNGVVRVLYVQMDGSMNYIDLPFTVKLVKQGSGIGA